MEISMAYDNELTLKATELRLGLPGTDEQQEQAVSSAQTNKRSFIEIEENSPSRSKAQIVGWPPVRSYRRNNTQPKKDESEGTGIYVKVSMDGAPYLRKIDLKMYKGYSELIKGLENMFKLTIGEFSEGEGYKGSDFVPTYEDKDGDWMLVGDVPWDMFMCSCNRLRIMRGSEAIGLRFGA